MSEAETIIEEVVRNRAYHLWEQAGSPEGGFLEFWHLAISELGSRETKPELFEVILRTNENPESRIDGSRVFHGFPWFLHEISIEQGIPDEKRHRKRRDTHNNSSVSIGDYMISGSHEI